MKKTFQRVCVIFEPEVGELGGVIVSDGELDLLTVVAEYQTRSQLLWFLRQKKKHWKLV